MGLYGANSSIHISGNLKFTHRPTPLALNSPIALIPTVIQVAYIINVTAIKDQMLRDGLAGYAEYSPKVRYRLILGVL